MSITKYHKDHLNALMDRLCQEMVPEKVANEMLKSKSFTKSDYEEVLHPPTSLLKNQKLLNLLQTKELNALTEFLRSLSSIDEKHRALAETVQPVKYRVLWLSTSPSQAAAVVHILERSGDASFSKMERVGKDKMLILRRARVFRTEYTPTKLKKMETKAMELVKCCHEVEVCLLFPRVFPSSSQNVAKLFEAVFKERLFPDVKLLCLGKLCDLDQDGGNSYVVSDVVTIDMGKELRAQPTLSPPELSTIRDISSRDINRVSVGVMQGKPYQKSQEAEEASAGDLEPVILDFDSMVLNFYVMCHRYTPAAASLACIAATPTSSGSSESEAAVKNSRALLDIVRCLYELWKNEPS